MKATAIRFVLLTLLLVVVAVVSLGVGDVRVSPAEVVQSLFQPSDSDLPAYRAVIVREVRLPRVLLAVVVGAALAAGGAGYQGLFRNPLADPFVIGASSGAALGATIAIVNQWEVQVLGFGPVSVLALCGALAAVGLVYGIASIGGQTPTASLLLAGVAVSSFLASLVWLIVFRNEKDLYKVVGWIMGTLNLRSWPEIWSSLPIVAAGTVLLWTMSRGLDALTFGEESAAGLGLRLNHFRGAVVVCSSLITAAAVAVCGIIGFVGLIAPHAARLMVGPRHAVLIPTSCLLGAILLLLADAAARTIVAPEELPVGVVTALLGAPFFLYFLKTRQQQAGL